MNLIGHNPTGLGIANAYLLAALMDALIDKGILSRAEVSKALDNAKAPIAPKTNIISVKDALSIIDKMQASFSE